MDNPQQVLLHLTSRGSKVRSKSGAVGRFINMSTQPINNINKYGLLHYSIPKTLDLLSPTNRTFTMRIVFHSGFHQDIPVTLPDMDYYNMRLDYANDDIGLPSFAEVLQTAINWAIQKCWTANRAYFAQLPLDQGVGRGNIVCNRLGCIVKVTNDKRLQFIIGWRGSPVATEITTSDGADPPVLTGTGVWRWYNNADGDDAKQAIQRDSGAPVTVTTEAKIMAQNGFRGITGSVGANSPVPYNFIDTNADVQEQSPAVDPDAWDNSRLHSVEFRGLSNRLQLMFGAPGSDIASTGAWVKSPWSDHATGVHHEADALIAEQGRMILVNYRGSGRPDTAAGRLGLLDFTMNIPPNLYAPSFMFLQLTAQGTKSKVLGHDAERGGWSIPTSSNQFKSKHDNFPGYESVGFVYDKLDVRQCPALFNLSEFLRETCEVFVTNKSADGAMAHRFDQIPFDPEGVVFQTGAGVQITELNNFALRTNAQFLVGDVNNSLTNHRYGSRMMHYGDLVSMTALAEKAPRKKKQFDIGSYGSAPTFTVSMIDPNWIYTDVPNSTVQSISILLMWGDTNKNVEEVSAYPVQFTMIASQ